MRESQKVFNAIINNRSCSNPFRNLYIDAQVDSISLYLIRIQIKR